MGIKNFGFETVETYLQKAIYFIPDYQREYSWIKDEQVDDFWTDLELAISEERNKHFFGQVVIHEDTTVNRKYIIDGQQRTTTSVIFLAVLRDFFEAIFSDSEHLGARNKYEDIRLKYIGRWTEDENELRLTLGKVDQIYFRDNIQIVKPIETPLEQSHVRIMEAYEYFDSNLRKKLAILSSYQEKYELLLKYYNKLLKDFQLMYVETDDMNEAFIIFETLNARGKDLETADLLKNHLFRTSGSLIENVKNDWVKTVENLENIDVTKFLRHYWNSKYPFSREKDLYKRIRNTVDTPRKCIAFVKSLDEMSGVYKTLVNPQEEFYFTDTDINLSLQHLKNLSASSFYPVVLSMCENEYEDRDINLIISLIETLIFRNCVIAGRVANKYEKLFSNVALDIAEREITTVDKIYKRIKDEIVTDDELENLFKFYSVKSTAVAKYILREINNYLDNEVQVINDNYKIHLEHVMPQKLGCHWNIDAEIHKKYLNRIGNLTLLGQEYNRNLKNRAFDVKGQVYHSSNLKITKSIAINYTTWDEKSIEKRQDELFVHVKKRWNIDAF